MSLDLRSLIGRLNGTTRRALEGAVGLCVSMTHYETDLEHWLVKLLEDERCDVAHIARRFGIDPDRCQRDLQQALQTFKSGSGRRPELSPSIALLVREAWLYTSVNFNQLRVRSGTILLAALSDVQLRRRLIDAHGDLRSISPEVLQKQLLDVVVGSREDEEAIADLGGSPVRDLAAPGRVGATATPALDQYTVDLTQAARAGHIDPVRGRDDEIRMIIDVLMRRRQNNPILTGEAGVGKTSVVEGFALRIASGDVPEPLVKVVLRTLDVGLLEAGAGVKGEFENRLKQVIAEVRTSAAPVILFIDEAHTIIGAGGQPGQNDAANLLKPALARGELRTIAATTWSEYKKYFEKDAALARRFQVIKIEEPSIENAVEMVRGLVQVLEVHHRVRVLDEAVESCVKLSSRYITARQLPDKAVSVLDTACARVAIGLQSTPGPIEGLRRHVEKLEREQSMLDRESWVGADHAARLAEVATEIECTRGELCELEEQWRRERTQVDQIQQLRSEIEERSIDGGRQKDPSSAGVVESPSESTYLRPIAALREEYEQRRIELAELRGERGLVLPEVDAEGVAQVISAWTGIPVGSMIADQIQTVLGLTECLKQRVIGQNDALETIARRIRTSRAGLDDPARPVGVFLLAGPSGVGKTETARALADVLYGGERHSVVINMSEYQEAHTVSGLKGSPPGYVGYGDGGVLTEAVRRRPHSVVLLDEVEKAHPDVLELFFQVFDKGVLEDAEGREVDFRNTVILLTSNVGAEEIFQLCADSELRPDSGPLAECIRPALRKRFPAALLGRLVVVPYYPISPESLASIVRLQLDQIRARAREMHAAELVCAEEVVDAIVARCKESESGARAVHQILTHSMLPQISSEILSRMGRGVTFQRIEVGIGPSAEFEVQVV